MPREDSSQSMHRASSSIPVQMQEQRAGVAHALAVRWSLAWEAVSQARQDVA